MKRYSWPLTLLLTLALLGGGGYFLWRSGFFAITSLEGMRTYIQNFAPCSHLIYFLIQLASVILAPSVVSCQIGEAHVTCRLETDYPFRDTLTYTVTTDRPVCRAMASLESPSGGAEDRHDRIRSRVLSCMPLGGGAQGSARGAGAGKR